MTIKRQLRIGNNIIEKGKVYLIFKVEITKHGDSSERILYYKPSYENPSNYSLVCSVPEKNIYSGNVREPVSLAELNLVMEYLSKGVVKNSENFGLLEAAEKFRSNNLYETVRVIKQCLIRQKSTDRKLNLNKKGVLSDAVEMMTEEVAHVYEITLEEAFERIKIASKKYFSLLQ